MTLRLIEAAANGLWQGAALAFLMGMAMRWAGSRLAPATRHRLWWLTLVLVGALPLVNLLPRSAPEALVVQRAGAAAVGAAPVAGVTPRGTFLPGTSGALVDAPAPELSPAVDAGMEERRPAPGPSGEGLYMGRGHSVLLLGLYGAGVLLLLGRLTLGLTEARRLRRSLRLPGLDLRDRFAGIRGRSGVRRRVRIGISDEVLVPATIGVRDPVILIPATLLTTLDADEVEAVLLHELAHVARRDSAWALLERALGAVLFFQPAVAWLGRRIALEREHACDEWVLAATGRREAYARCLLRVAEHAVRGPALPAGALSMASRLGERIERLLRPTAPGAAAHPVPVVLCLTPLVLAWAAVAGPRLSVRDAHARSIDPVVSRPAPDLAGAAARVDDLLRRLEAYGLDGAVLVARGPDVILRAGFGEADRSRGTAFDPATPFNAGAFAKLLTAAAVMKLAEQGRLRVTDRVADYLGPFPEPKSDATIHQLLTHTAGLARPWAPIYREDRSDFIAAVRETPAEYPAGTGHRYTDQGHALLAAVIEITSGESYEAFVRRTLLEPAGMTSTRFESEPPAAGEPGQAVEYLEPAGSGSRVRQRDYVWGRRGAMGVITTLDDLWRFHRAFEDGRLLRATTRQAMLRGYTDAGRSTRIGYGWEVATSARGGTLRHRLSAWNNSSVEIAYDEADDLFVALVADAATNWASPKYRDVLAAARADAGFVPPVPIDAAIENPTPVTGRYTRPGGGSIRVRAIAPGRLRLDTEDPRLAAALTRDGAPRATVDARRIADGAFAVAQWNRHTVRRLYFDAAGDTLRIDGVGILTRSGR